MDDYFGTALRTLREHTSTSLGGLAKRVGFTKPYLSRIENGHRQPPAGLAEALDEFFGTSPLFVLLGGNKGGEDTVQRRALLSTVGLSLGAGVGMPDWFSQVVRHMLDGDRPEILTDLVRRYEQRYFVQRDPNLAPELLAEVMIVMQRAKEHATPPLLEAGARLCLLYGLLEGDFGKLASAQGWYRTAAGMADTSKDAATAAYVRGYATNRGLYEGLSVREALAAIERVLRMSPGPTAGAMEAYAAQIHLAGLRERYDDGLRAADAMAEVAEQLPVPDHAATPVARAAMFRDYLVCRVGPLRDAEPTHRASAPLFANVPYWSTDMNIYWGRALVRSGEVEEGVQTALTAMQHGPSSIRVHAVAVRDLLDLVPAGYHSDALDELKTYSSPEPGPWETLRA